jgi:hypothetical protein
MTLYKRLVVIIGILVTLNSCAVHSRSDNNCMELFRSIRRAVVECSSRKQGNKTNSWVVLNINALEAKLNMNIVVTNDRDNQPEKRCAIEFWQDGKRVAKWLPGCRQCYLEKGSLMLEYWLEDGIQEDHTTIYDENGNICKYIIG